MESAYFTMLKVARGQTKKSWCGARPERERGNKTCVGRWSESLSKRAAQAEWRTRTFVSDDNCRGEDDLRCLSLVLLSSGAPN